MKQTVAAYIAKTLESAGVKRIWGVIQRSSGRIPLNLPLPMVSGRSGVIGAYPSIMMKPTAPP